MPAVECCTNRDWQLYPQRVPTQNLGTSSQQSTVPGASEDSLMGPAGYKETEAMVTGRGRD